MSPEEFRRCAHESVDWIADYLSHPERYPVLPRIEPGQLADALPPSGPELGEPMERLLEDFQRLIVPAITHWNHPGFMAYFANTAPGPGIVAELLAAALNANAMLWKTSPGSGTHLFGDPLGEIVDLDDHVSPPQSLKRLPCYVRAEVRAARTARTG